MLVPLFPIGRSFYVTKPASFELEAFINATPERVFTALTDIDDWKNWMPGLIGLEKLTTGPFETGTAWRESRKMMGHTATEQFEVTAVEPLRTIALRVDGTKGTTGKGEFRFTYILAPEAPGTRLKLSCEIHMPGWFAQTFPGMMSGVFKKACNKDFEAFKAYLERPAKTLRMNA